MSDADVAVAAWRKLISKNSHGTYLQIQSSADSVASTTRAVWRQAILAWPSHLRSDYDSPNYLARINRSAWRWT